jgi:hypothetical protein
MPIRTSRMLALAAVLVPALLVGCGGSSSNGVASKTPSEILAASRAAAEDASSVHIVGESAQGPLKLVIDMALSREAGHSRLNLLGSEFEVIRTGNTIYLKGSSHFYHQLGLDPAKVPANTWIKVTNTTSSSSGLASLANLRLETRQLLGSTGPVTKGANTSIGGQPAIELKTSGRLYTGAIYVATTGQPYPLKLERHGKETSHITMTSWNQPVSVSAPANSITVSQAGGKEVR